MNRRVLLSMVVSWLLIGSVMNIEGRRTSGLLEQASAHAAPCAPPEYHQFDFWVGDWDVFDVASQTNTFDAVRGRARRQSRCLFGPWPQPKHWSAAEVASNRDEQVTHCTWTGGV